jgi:hypothetical protein
MITRCPECNRTLARTTGMIEEAPVLGCRNCAVFYVEGLDQVVRGGPGLLDTLRLLAAKLKDAKATENLAMESPIGGRLWEAIS